MSYRTAARDPYWLESRFPGTCAKCGATIVKGERIFYYPNGRKAYSGKCAEAAAADFESMRFDENAISGGMGGY